MMRPGSTATVALVAAGVVVAMVVIAPMSVLAIAHVEDAASPRVVAVGDLHGDLPQTVKVLQAAGLLREDVRAVPLQGDGNGGAFSSTLQWAGQQQHHRPRTDDGLPTPLWAGGAAVLVQTGDVMDRGPDTRAIFDLLLRLQQEAPHVGGEVVLTLGNHETMNLVERGMVHPDDVASFGGRRARTRALAADGDYGSVLRGLPAVAIVGGTVFSHAGVLPHVARKLGGVDGINDALRRVLLPNSRSLGPWSWSPQSDACAVDSRHHSATDAPHCVSEAEAKELVMSSDGPLWTRRFAAEPWDERGEADLCRLVDASLSELGGRRMVIGHTVQQSGQPTIKCGGKLILNDVGISRWVSADGAVAAVEIIDGHARALGEESRVAAFAVPEQPSMRATAVA